jgi:pectate lyase
MRRIGSGFSTVCIAFFLFACSDDTHPTSSQPKGGVASSGGSTSSGGLAGSGGSVASGGTIATTGVATTGGMPATGGTIATGGSPSTGGARGTGGTPGTAGTASTGGTPGTAGMASTGGRLGTAGTGGSGSGGAVATSSAATTGGSSGGTSGGSGGRGGATGTGGVGTATGGATGRGGTTSTASAMGTGGSGAGGTTSADGCPLTLEGFATINVDGQNGTYGGRDGETVTVTNQADLNRYLTATQPYTIRVQGKITISPQGTELKVNSDKTIIGVGSTGEIDQGGFFLGADVHNVIIRNLTIGNTKIPSDTTGKEYDYDGIQMDTAHHVWIDHCMFHDINDGMIDSRKDTTYVTTSWNILHDHNKAYGIGWTDNVTAQMTIHHNVIRDTVQRNPSTDNVLRAHLFNNWLLRVESYGSYSRQGTNMVLENCVFDQVNDPYYYDTGTLVAIGNVTRNTTGQKESSGSTYSFFDPNQLYKYTLDQASQVEALLTKCAGPRAELGK